MIITLHVVKIVVIVFLVSENFLYFIVTMHLSFSNKTRKIIALQKIRTVRNFFDTLLFLKAYYTTLICCITSFYNVLPGMSIDLIPPSLSPNVTHLVNGM